MNGLDLTEVRTLTGPNVWARVSVLEASFRGETSTALSVARRAQKLQNVVGCRVSFASATEDRLAVEYEHETLGRRCLEASVASVGAQIPNQSFDSTATLVALRELADQVVLGANTRALANAARRRSIPVRRLDDGSLLQLGHGIHQRRLCGAFTDRTSSIAETISWDKHLAKDLLSAVGIPVPEGCMVTDPDVAWKAAQDLRGPVVIKPESANHGRAVFIGLTERVEITAAFEAARREGSTPNVVVERFIPALSIESSS